MSLDRPTLSEIIARVESDISSAVGITTFLSRTFWRGIAKAIAGVAHLIYGFLVYLSKQLFADQSEKEYLLRQAGVYNFQKTPATYTELNVTFTGVDGKIIPIDTELQSSTGLIYTVKASVTIVAGIAVAILKAENSGVSYNLGDGSELTFISPITDIDQTTSVDSTNVQAADIETDAAFRARFLEYLRDPPAGGKATDYIAWAKEISGVTRAWVYPLWLGTGTVGNTFVLDNDPVSIIPGGAKITEVDDNIKEQAPVTAVPGITTFAPNEHTLDMTIKLSPNTATVQAEVTAEIEDLLLREANPKGSWKNSGETYDGKILISKLREAVSRAAGEDDNEITVPIADVEPVADNDLVILGVITFQDLP